MYKTSRDSLILDTTAEYMKLANNITRTTRKRKKVKSVVPIWAATALLKGLITKREKRTMKKKRPENKAFLFCPLIATTTEIYTRLA